MHRCVFISYSQFPLHPLLPRATCLPLPALFTINTRCGREFSRFLSRTPLVQGATTGMDERTGRGQGHQGIRTKGPFNKGHQVRDAFSTLKVEFNCWRIFRGEGHIPYVSQPSRSLSLKEHRSRVYRNKWRYPVEILMIR